MAAGSSSDEVASGFGPQNLFVRSHDALWRQADDVVLVRTASEPEVVELVGTGVLLWLALADPVTAPELASDLAAVLDAPVEVVERDVLTALSDLLRRGVVTYAGERP